MIKTYTDREIVQCIKNGDTEQVLGYLYRTSQFKITKWVLQNNGSEEDAQDIFQDAVLSLYDYVISGKFQSGKSVDAFLFAIGRNAWINRAKQKQKILTGERQMEMLGQVPDHSNLMHELDGEKNTKIDLLLTQLGERCQQLLTYSIFYDMRMDKIAEKMGFSGANAAKTKNYKCKQRLMKIIKENNIDDLRTWIYQ